LFFITTSSVATSTLRHSYGKKKSIWPFKKFSFQVYTLKETPKEIFFKIEKFKGQRQKMKKETHQYNPKNDTSLHDPSPVCL
jgi:hypothetical protein